MRLLVPLVLLVACDTPATDTSSTDTAGNGGDTGDTAAAFAPTAGTYTMTAGAYGGTCDSDNNVSGSLNFTSFDVALSAGGFDMAYDDDTFDTHVRLSCTLTDQDFTCTGEPLVEMESTSDKGTTTVAFALTASGTWASETEISFTLEGNLSCEGVAAECTDTQTNWGLEMPCTMSYPYTGTM